MEVTRDERLVRRVIETLKMKLAGDGAHTIIGNTSYHWVAEVMDMVDVQDIVARHREQHLPNPGVAAPPDDKRCEETIDHKRCRLPYGHDSHRGDGILWMPSADRSEVDQAREDAFLNGLRQGFGKGYDAGLTWLKSVAFHATDCLRRGHEDAERATNAFINQERVRNG